MRMKSIMAFILAACMLCSLLVACDSSNAETNGTTLESDRATESTEPDNDTTTSDGEPSDTEEPTGGSDKDETTSTEQNGGDGEDDIVAALPEEDAELVYAMYGGYSMSQYAGKGKNDYLAACKYYEEQGYTLQSSNVVGKACSSVYVNDDAYVNIMYNENKRELYIGESESGASSFPDGEEILDFEEPTITQHYSPEINGMCYFIKLSDGTFIVVDGGYVSDLEDAYKTLVKLNGSEYGIHIRAWLITHSHADHYEMFENFSQKYAKKVTLDTVMFSPLGEVNAFEQDKYLNSRVYTAAARFGAETCHIYTGMSFIFGDITLEILASPEHIYKTSDPQDFNETSVVFRIRNDEGSMIFLADCGSYVCDWLVDTYGEALKSDMVQLAHHGCETATIEVYQMIAAATLFCPSSESLLNTERGGEVKQYYIEAESSKEYLYHGFGNITRPLSYKPDTQYLNIMPDHLTFVKAGNNAVENLRIEDGVLKYEVKNVKGDPYIYVNYKKSDIKTTEYNALKIVVGAGDAASGTLFFSTHNDEIQKFNPEKFKYTTEQGVSTDDKTTIIIYLGDVPEYSDSEGKINSIRFDLGTEDGQTIEIYSIEAFKITVDE